MWSSRRVKSSACGILEIEFDQVTSRQEELWQCWKWNGHNNDMRDDSESTDRCLSRRVEVGTAD